MSKNSENFFLVIEGLDGAGKTVISRYLVHNLTNLVGNEDKVKLTYEPHDPSCAGLFIRQVLTKKIKVDAITLATAFAANRLDHCVREINPFLRRRFKNRIIVCDRYYLSSLVYQSNELEKISIEKVWELNKNARKPDLIMFLDASDKTCYERMKLRRQEKELFEKNLRQTRKKYYEAIAFLRELGIDIVELNSDGSIQEVYNYICEALLNYGPKWLNLQPILFEEPVPQVFSLDGDRKFTVSAFAEKFNHHWNQGPILDEKMLHDSLSELIGDITANVAKLTFNDLGSLFLDLLSKMGFTVGSKLTWSDLDAYEIEYSLPLNINQQGTAVLISELHRYDIILKKAEDKHELSDFMLVFLPNSSKVMSDSYQRGRIRYSNGREGISPAIKIFGIDDIVKGVMITAMDLYYHEHLYTFSGNQKFKKILRNFMSSLNIE